MKITLERLREIITEEVIKEELAPDIAAPAIAAMLQGSEAEVTSDIFGAVFDQMYGEGALDAEAERMANAGEPEEESFPTDYQAGGAYGDRPKIGFKEEIAQIVREAFEGLELSDSELENMSDRELIDVAHQDGVEEFIVLDLEGDLANRDEVLAALKDV
tara:strand:- start:57 stop:536 length:480 start_codon:yes stop_codon:yes gene_type:complete